MAEEEAAAGKPAGKGSIAKLIMALAVGGAILIVVTVGAVFYMMKSMGMLYPEGSAAKAAMEMDQKDPANYQSLDPPFVVNYKDRGRNRYLQASIQAMTRDKTVLKDLTDHMPLIRNNILLLLAAQDAETLTSNEGREKIRQQALKELNDLLETETGKPDSVEALYFTSFVTQ